MKVKNDDPHVVRFVNKNVKRLRDAGSSALVLKGLPNRSTKWINFSSVAAIPLCARECEWKRGSYSNYPTTSVLFRNFLFLPSRQIMSNHSVRRLSFVFTRKSRHTKICCGLYTISLSVSCRGDFFPNVSVSRTLLGGGVSCVLSPLGRSRQVHLK